MLKVDVNCVLGRKRPRAEGDESEDEDPAEFRATPKKVKKSTPVTERPTTGDDTPSGSRTSRPSLGTDPFFATTVPINANVIMLFRI